MHGFVATDRHPVHLAMSVSLNTGSTDTKIAPLGSTLGSSETAKTFWGGRCAYPTDARFARVSSDPPTRRLSESLFYLVTYDS